MDPRKPKQRPFGQIFLPLGRPHGGGPRRLHPLREMVQVHQIREPGGGRRRLGFFSGRRWRRRGRA